MAARMMCMQHAWGKKYDTRDSYCSSGNNQVLSQKALRAFPEQ